MDMDGEIADVIVIVVFTVEGVIDTLLDILTHSHWRIVTLTYLAH